MSMSISCDECGLNYVGGRKAPGHLRPAAPRPRPARSGGCCSRSGASRRRRSSCWTTGRRRHPDLRRVPRPARVQPSTSGATTPCRSSPACGRWVTARRSTTPRRTSSPSCATTASSCSATRRPGTPWSAAPGRTSERSPTRLDVVRTSTRVTAVSRKPDAVELDDELGRAPRVRQGRHRHARRRRAAPAHRRRRGRDRAAGRLRLLHQRGAPAPRRVGAARAARRARQLELPARGAATRSPTAARCPTG